MLVVSLIFINMLFIEVSVFKYFIVVIGISIELSVASDSFNTPITVQLSLSIFIVSFIGLERLKYVSAALLPRIQTLLLFSISIIDIFLPLLSSKDEISK